MLSFLTVYQYAKPMMPFLYDDLYQLLKDLTLKFNIAGTPFKILQDILLRKNIAVCSDKTVPFVGAYVSFSPLHHDFFFCFSPSREDTFESTS